MQKMIGRALACAAALGMTLVMSACSPSGDSTPTPSSSSGTVIGPSELPSVPPADETPTSTPTPTITPVPPSSTMDGVDATGDFGEAPTLTVPSPWAIDKTQTKILVQGQGATVPDTGLVSVNYYGVDARTGEKFDESYSRGAPATFSLGPGMIAGFTKGLAGQKVGTRLIIAINSADGYDSDGGKSQAGIAVGDTLVFVVDILNAEVTKPTGQTVTVTDSSLPTVGGDLDKPTVTIPSSDPPSKLVVQPLVKGEGPEVAEGDFIQVNYAEYTWQGQKLIRQTYGFSPLSGALSGTIPGWQQALVGQPQGSRLLLVVPPDLSYPEGYPKLGIDKGTTMVYVVDIQFTTAA